VLKLAKLPKVVMKYSNANKDMKPIVRKCYDAFGPDRMIWDTSGTIGLASTRKWSCSI